LRAPQEPTRHHPLWDLQNLARLTRLPDILPELSGPTDLPMNYCYAFKNLDSRFRVYDSIQALNMGYSTGSAPTGLPVSRPRRLLPRL
jgi:hypothetical protein